MKTTLLLTILSLAGVATLTARDDDIAYAVSLEKSGYYWLAIQEFKELMPQMPPKQQVLQHKRLAGLYEKVGDLAARDREYRLLLEQGTGKADPLITKAVKEARTHLMRGVDSAAAQAAEDIGKLLAADEVDEERLALRRQALKQALDELCAYRDEQLARREKRKARSTAQARELSRRKFAAGKTHYLYSYLHRGTDDAKYAEVLTDVYSRYFKDIDAEVDIEIALYRGMVLQELKRHREATASFRQCIAFPRVRKNESVRKESYYRAVDSLFTVDRHRDCAELALNYLYEFPVKRERITERERTLQSRLVSSLGVVRSTDDEVYMRRTVRGGGSYVVLECRPKRAILSQQPVRTYTVIGSGGSSAVIEMPSVRVEGVNTTVICPAN